MSWSANDSYELLLDSWMLNNIKTNKYFAGEVSHEV